MYLTRRRPPTTDEEVVSPLRRRSWRYLIVAPNVAFLGMTSLVTDISSEMVAAVLPLYLTAHLGFSALQFGATDGLLQIATALTALVGALAADRWGRYREVAGAGYGVSAASRLGLLTTTSWLPTLGWLSADRVGKGVRTGPRDALISLSAPPGRVAEAFGLHRALDTFGALLGPLVAVALLTLAPGSYQTVFVASFLIALVGLALLWLFVENRRPLRSLAAKAAVGLWDPIATLWTHSAFRRVLLAAALLSLPAVSDSFLFLTLRREVGVDQRWFPILFVGESVVYLLLALPFGRLADRVGAGRVLLGGQLALAASYALLLGTPGRTVSLVAVPACLGLFFATTDGVLAALASECVPGLARTTGLAVVGVAVAGGRALAATGFGAVWERSGPHRALSDALVGLVVCAVLAAVVLRPFLFTPSRRPRHHETGGDGDGDVFVAPAPAPNGGPTDPRGRPGDARTLRVRVVTFVMIGVLCAAGIVGVTLRARRQSLDASRASSAHSTVRTGSQAEVSGDRPVALTASVADLASRPNLAVLDTASGPDFGRLELADRADPAGARAPTDLLCDRVDIRAGRGICLTNDRAQGERGIAVLDDRFNVVATLPLSGLPSRTRVAPNGAVAAATSFVEGDAYNIDSFSTRTVLVDLVHPKVMADLEEFALTKNGKRFYAVDQNFWGLTFAADSDTFYATLRTGGHYYLVRGHVGTRRAEVLRDRVECPSLSPDGTRLVYKSRIDHGFDPATWRLHVFDLVSGADHPLAETRNVDDQAAWADDANVLYGVQDSEPGSSVVDTWKAAADGSGTPTLEVPRGESPVPVG